jgi:hypothetical protein
LEIPTDAFKVQLGEISGCEIIQDDFSLGFEIDESGRIVKFPVMLNGEIAQAEIVYNEFSVLSAKPEWRGSPPVIQEMAVTFPSGNDPWELEFLEYRNSFPYLVRAYCGDPAGGEGGIWYFIYFSWGISEILESWYDENGQALGAYGFSLADVGKNPRIRTVKDYSAAGSSGGDTRLFYDSRGLVTGISGTAGVFNVLYFREDLPRYWESRPAAKDATEDSDSVIAGNFALQWDETGLLRRLSGEDENSGLLIDYRYEYTLDGRGNWIERRETRMIPQLGILVPSAGTVFRRVIEYKE